MFGHVDDVLPDTTAGLRQLRASVFDFGRAEETAFFGKVAVSMIVLALSPMEIIIMPSQS